MAESKKEGFSIQNVLTPYIANGGMWQALAGLLFSLAFAQGASKIAQGQTSSQFVSIGAFFFAPLYQTYQALVSQSPPGGLGTVLGAARRLRR